MNMLICNNVDNAEDFQQFQAMKACLLGFKGVSDENFITGKIYEPTEQEQSSWSEAFKLSVANNNAITAKQVYFNPEGTCLNVTYDVSLAGHTLKLFQKDHEELAFIKTVLGYSQAPIITWCDHSITNAAMASNAATTVALLDIDETLALTKSFERGALPQEQGQWYLNETLVQALIAAHIEDVYFFTAYHARGVAKRHADWMDRAPSRLYLKEALEERGIHVHGIVVPYDIAYRHGPGKHFEHHIGPHEAIIKAGHDLDTSLESRYAQDCAQEMRWSAANTGAKHDKGEMFEYLLEQIPALKDKRLIFVDDSRGHIETVKNKAKILNQPLTIVKCSYDLTVEDYLKDFCGIEQAHTRLVEQQTQLDAAYRKSMPLIFEMSSTKINREISHAKRFSSLALCHLARRYLVGNGVSQDPINARKLFQLAYTLAETDLYRQQASLLLGDCLLAIYNLPEGATSFLNEKDVSARVLETTYLEQAPVSEKALFHRRLAMCYSHEISYAGSSIATSALRHSVECYALAWQLGYRYEDQNTLVSFKNDFHALVESNQHDFPAIKEEFLGNRFSDFRSFFSAMDLPETFSNAYHIKK